MTGLILLPLNVASFLLQAKYFDDLFASLAGITSQNLAGSLYRAVQIQNLLDPKALIQWGGVAGIAVVVFIETGLFVGFFLPGDSLLIVAGILASQGILDLRAVILFACIAAIAGDQAGYMIGSRLGQNLASRYPRFQRYVIRAQEFFARHGAKTITLARFVPVIRTFAPAVAGAAEMKYRRFVTYNIVGGIGWVTLITVAGYLLGSFIHNLEQDLLLVIVVVVAISFLPYAVELIRNRRNLFSKT